MAADTDHGPVRFDDHDDLTAGDAPASSPMAHLLGRIDAARESDVVDFPVEVDATTRLVFRFKAVGFDAQEQIKRRHRGKGGKGDVEDLRRAASLLAWANVGVFHEDDDGQLVTLDPDGSCFIDADTDRIVGEPVTISSRRMFELLGVESSLEVLRTLLPRELVMQRMVLEVTEHSTGGSVSALGN